jgi:glutathione S-transferase
LSAAYIIFGSEMSPYSVKVRSWFRFKGLPHAWTPRRAENEAEYRKHARLPIVPTVVTPDGEGMQDSTPIMEALEARHPQPSTHPEDPRLRFVSELVEEFGDEWGNKLIFHHRWYAPVDQQASAQTLAFLGQPDARPDQIAERTARVLERMTGRGHFVGSSPANAPLITAWYVELLDLLQAHLVGRRYLFGDRPAFGDFGLAAQLYEASIDPTCGGLMRARAPAVLDWCYRMNEPRIDGAFESWDSLAPALAPLLAYIGRTFLPWSDANARALAAGDESFTVDLPGGAYQQQPQKYHAKSLAVLRGKFAAAPADASLESLLAESGCLRHLQPR